MTARDDSKFVRLIDGRQHIGFWCSRYEPYLPDPHHFVDANWDPIERAAVADYFDRGRVLESYKGWSSCRICGEDNGEDDLSDGHFIWPSGFGHYVRVHSVRPPIVLVRYALRGPRR